MKYDIKVETVPLNMIEGGDTVIVNGQHKTVNPEYLHINFYGMAYEGQPYRNGIERVLYPKWKNGAYVGHVRRP